jgi:eukaryotic-like serine/threonine-protein kinase
MPNVTPLRPDDPRRVGRYRLTGRVDEFTAGETGQSAVFLAQRPDSETVMITLLAADRTVGPAARDRFAAEARAARRVPPFCVARIMDAGFENGRPYLVTESVPGATLAEIIALEGPLPTETLRALAAGCATGIASIHQTGLVHGQFGPQMVMLGREGPQVIHLTITPPYGDATPAADMLAWARAVLFAATGRPPAMAQDLEALPADLRSVVADCLSPDPAGRPPARAVLTELLSGMDLSAGLLTEGSRQARAAARATVSTAAPPGRRAPRRAQSKTALWIAACAACVLAIAVAATYISRRHTGPHPATAAGPVVPSSHAAPGRAASPQATPHGTAESLGRAPQRAIPARFAGAWWGTVHQAHPALSVTVRITLARGTAQGTIGYPQLGCRGTLALASAGDRLIILGLTITRGQGSCVGGTVRLAAQPDGSLRFTFLQGGGDNPTGRLTRAP